MPHKLKAPIAIWILSLSCQIGVFAAPGDTDSDNADAFQRDIRPFLNKHCVECHGPNKQKADFAVHDIDGRITAGKDVVRWEKILELLSLGDMPPAQKPQPSPERKQKVVRWIGTQLAQINRGPDAAKLALPSQGNRVSHAALFSGEHRGPASSPPRLWRKSPHIYKRQTDEILAVSQPFLGLGGTGFEDYASLAADEATLKTMLRNSHLLAEALLKQEGRHAHLAYLYQGDGEPSKADIDKAIRHIFQTLLHRDPGAEDIDYYVSGLYRKNAALGGWRLGLHSLIVGLLMSQEFVFRMEIGLGETLPDGRRMLSPMELAFALSFAFYDKPDPALIALAREGKLKTKADVEREARRILETPDEQKHYWDYPMYHLWGRDYYGHHPRLLRFFQEFFGYTAAVDVFKDKQRNPRHHPRRLRKDADMLVLAVLEKDKDVIETLLTTHRYVMDYFNHDKPRKFLDTENRNENLFEHFKNKFPDFERIIRQGLWPGLDSEHTVAYLPLEAGNEIRRRPGDDVALPQDQRAGMLTHPAWLVAHSGNFDNDPVRRGKWIRERLLAGMVPDVPIGVDAKVPEDPHRTLKERFDIVRDEACWRCHKKMNPLGEPFEMFDDFGRYRERILVGDVEGYLEKKGRHDHRKRSWEKDLEKWRHLDAAGRARKIEEAQRRLADARKPEASDPRYKKKLRDFENHVERWTREIEALRNITDAMRRDKIAQYQKLLAELEPPVPESKPVDARGSLEGTGDPELDGPVEDAVDLAHRLARSERVRQSVIRHAFRYWMGRNETLNDSPTLMAADKAYVDHGGSFKEMLIALLTSDSFLTRK